MCTISFVPGDRCFTLAMNRDESLVRPLALPPRTVRIDGVFAAYPHEPAGGTWIGANDHGVAAALLNWHMPPPGPKVRSRGEIIPRLLAQRNWTGAKQTLRSFDLGGIWPFRLVAFSSHEQSVCEWRWNGAELKSFPYEWQPRHWFSSGASDAEAERRRGAVFDQAWKQPGAGSLRWIRAIHSAHGEERGAFSVCVHREGVGSLSYTEIEVRRDAVEIRYVPGSPCETLAGEPSFSSVHLPLAELDISKHSIKS